MNLKNKRTFVLVGLAVTPIIVASLVPSSRIEDLGLSASLSSFVGVIAVMLLFAAVWGRRADPFVASTLAGAGFLLYETMEFILGFQAFDGREVIAIFVGALVAIAIIKSIHVGFANERMSKNS
jgi:hypothetical protein